MNQQDVKHMYIRYMWGVGLRCLSRVYHQPITKIYEAIKEYQNQLNARATGGRPQTGIKRNRPSSLRRRRPLAKNAGKNAAKAEA